MNRALAFLLVSLLLAACADAPADREITFTTDAAHTPAVAHDAQNGTTYVAWISRDGEDANVYLSTLTDRAATPGEPVRVNDVDGDANPHEQAPVRLAVGADGEGYVAWTNAKEVEGRRFPASDLRFARSTDGGATFTPAVTVNDGRPDDPPTSQSFHDMTVGPDGTLFFSWLDSRARDRARAAMEGGHAQNVSHARDDHGDHDHHVGHGAHDMPGTQVRVSRSEDGGQNFTTSMVLAENTCECCRTAIRTDSNGTVYVVWRHKFDDNIRDIAVMRSDDGGASFTEPRRVHADGWHVDGCPHSGPAVAIDAEDRLHVAWFTGAEGCDGLYYASSDTGGEAFGTPQRLAQDSRTIQSSIINVASLGSVVAWPNRSTGTVHVGSLSDNGQETASLMQVEDGSQPVLTADGDRTLLVYRGAQGLFGRWL